MMDNQEISLPEIVVRPEENVQLPQDTIATPPLPTEIAKSRAEKASFATGRPYESLYTDIVQGQEDKARREVASEITSKRQQLKFEIVNKILEQKKGKKFTPEEYKVLENTLKDMEQADDPESIFEEQYAKRYIRSIEEAAQKNPDASYNDAKLEVPDVVAQALKIGDSAIAKREYAVKKMQDMHGIVENQSYIGWGADLAKTLVPFYTEVKMRGLMEGVSTVAGVGLGTNLYEQSRALLDLPFKQYKEKFDAILTELSKDNPHLALAFATAVGGRSTSDEVVDNLFTGLEVLNAAQFGKIGLNAAQRLIKRRSTENAVEAVKDMVKAADSAPEATKAKLAAAAGDVGTSAEETVTERLANRHYKSTVNINKEVNPTKEALEALPSAWKLDWENIRANPGRLGNDIINKLEYYFTKAPADILTVISNVAKVHRIPEAVATKSVVQAARKEITDRFSGVAVLDYSDVKWNAVTNTYHIYADIGKPGGELFMSKQAAENYAKLLNLDSPNIRPVRQGIGYYIRVERTLDETQELIRDAFLKTKDSAFPKFGPLGSWLTKLRTSEEVLPLMDRANRKIAIYTANALERLATEQAAEISKLARWTFPGTKKRERWLDWKRVVDASRRDLDKEGRPGMFFDNPAQLEQYYIQMLKRAPDEQEIAAYFAFKHFTELDHTMRNIRVYSNKARLGTEQWQLIAKDKDGIPVKSGFFDGVVRNVLPGGGDTVLFIDGDLNSAKTFYAGKAGRAGMNQKRLDEIRQGIKDGRYKVVEIYDPEARPLADFGTKLGTSRIRYIVTSKAESKPLSYDQVPRRGGGHFDYEYDWYIKQAKIRPESLGPKDFKHWYEGDVTIMPMQVRKQAQEIAQHLDEVRKLIKNKDNAAAKLYAEKNLPMDWKDVRNFFISHTDPVSKKRVLAPLSLDEPIQVMKRDTMIGHVDNTLMSRYANFVDGTRSGSLARQYSVAYTGPRDAYDLHTIRDVGTRHNPLFKYEPARMVDPMETMNRAMTRIVNSTFLDDYKIFSADRWVKEAAPYLDLKNINEVQYAPWHYFAKPSWKRDAPKHEIERLETARWKMQELWGTPNTLDTILHATASNLYDSLYKRIGGSGVNALPKFLDPMWVMPKLNDPLSMLRAITFHYKLGLFNPASLLTQLQTWTTITSVAGPRFAMPGTKATMLHEYMYWSSGGEAMLKHLDDLATQTVMPGMYKWKPGWWKEAYEGLMNHGFDIVGREHAWRDNAMSHKVIEGVGGKMLDWGSWFFKTGERKVREASWYTSYLEYRTKINPVGKITREDWMKILDRADMLSGNMSGASKSALHTGVMSLPGQFLSYQLRMWELMTGKRLTGPERLRMIAGYGFMYGIPSSFALTGLPVGDYFKRVAYEHDYVPGDNPWISAVMEGFPAYMAALVTGTVRTGELNASAGNWYNVSDKLGLQGFESLREALRSDNSFLKIMTGAAGSVVAGTWQGMDAFYQYLSSMARGDEKQFPTTAADVVDAFREISSVHSTANLLHALNTGNALSKKGNIIEQDISAGGAIFRFLTGLRDIDSAEMDKKTWSLEAQKQVHKTAEDMFIKYFRRGLEAGANKDPDMMYKYHIQAFKRLEVAGYPADKYDKVISRALKDYESLVDSINEDFYLKRAPEGQEQNRIKTLQRIQELKELRRK